MICRMNVRRQLTSIVRMCCAVFLTIALGKTACGAKGANAKPVTIVSPKGKTKIRIRTDAAGQLTWSVQRHSQIVLAAAPLCLTVDGHNLGQSAILSPPRRWTKRERRRGTRTGKPLLLSLFCL